MWARCCCPLTHTAAAGCTLTLTNALDSITIAANYRGRLIFEPRRTCSISKRRRCFVIRGAYHTQHTQQDLGRVNKSCRCYAFESRFAKSNLHGLFTLTRITNTKTHSNLAEGPYQKRPLISRATKCGRSGWSIVRLGRFYLKRQSAHCSQQFRVGASNQSPFDRAQGGP